MQEVLIAVGLPFTSVLAPLCSRHPVRHIAFSSHRLITANVPYERVVRNSDLDGFATHRRSVGGAGLVAVQKIQFSLISVIEPTVPLFPTDMLSDTVKYRRSRGSDVANHVC